MPLMTPLYQGGMLDIVPDPAVGGRGGVGDMAGDLGLPDAAGAPGEGASPFGTLETGHAAEINAAGA